MRLVQSFLGNLRGDFVDVRGLRYCVFIETSHVSWGGGVKYTLEGCLLDPRYPLRSCSIWPLDMDVRAKSVFLFVSK